MSSRDVSVDPSASQTWSIPEEMHADLRAIHRVLIQARWMAYQGRDHAAIAEVLDSAELMPLLLIPGEPSDLTILELLQGLAQRFPEFQGICETYQAESVASQDAE